MCLIHQILSEVQRSKGEMQLHKVVHLTLWWKTMQDFGSGFEALALSEATHLRLVIISPQCHGCREAPRRPALVGHHCSCDAGRIST